MAAPLVDWQDATAKVTVSVHYTTKTKREEFDVPAAAFAAWLGVPALVERCARLEAALAGAVTAIEVVLDGGTEMSGEEMVERLLYPEHFGLDGAMLGKKAYERIEIARAG